MNGIKTLPRSFVILLERDTRRVRNVQQNILAHLPECEVWTATDSRSGEVDDFLNGGTVTVARSYRRRLTRGKVAVTMSHLRLWQIVKEDIGSALILEDDVKVLDGFRETLAHILCEVPEDYHFIYLYAHPRYFRPDRSANHIPGKQYVMRHSFTYCRLAYVVTTEGARRLIDHFRTLFDHGDMMISKAIERGVIWAYMSRKVLVHNLGQLTRFYDKEVLPSNIWPAPTRFSMVRRRLRELFEDARRRAGW